MAQRSVRTKIELIVRRPPLRFDGVMRNWMPANPAFGYQLNGGSLVLPYLEPYLIRVMKQARHRLVDRRPDLLQDIDLFNAQEANHFRLHAGYNAMLRERYDGIAAIEAEIEADFARMLREESLEWNLGYAAGFETTGMITAELFFRATPESLVGADPAVLDLWGWHLAEEFEHRCVAFDVYRELVGGWRNRVRLFFHQSRHLRGFGDRAARLMREQDMRDGLISMRPDDIAARNRLERRQARYALRRIAAGLMPWHEPRNAPDLDEAEAFLTERAWG